MLTSCISLRLTFLFRFSPYFRILTVDVILFLEKTVLWPWPDLEESHALPHSLFICLTLHCQEVFFQVSWRTGVLSESPEIVRCWKTLQIPCLALGKRSVQLIHLFTHSLIQLPLSLYRKPSSALGNSCLGLCENT